MSVAKLRELKRLFQIIKTPSVIFLRKNDSPLKDGAEVQIEFDIACGQGRALSLRYNIKFNFIITVSRYIYVNFHGRSKPLPYMWDIIFYSVQAPTSFRYSLLSFLCRKARHRSTAADYKIGKSTEKRPLCFLFSLRK